MVEGKAGSQNEYNRWCSGDRPHGRSEIGGEIDHLDVWSTRSKGRGDEFEENSGGDAFWQNRVTERGRQF